MTDSKEKTDMVEAPETPDSSSEELVTSEQEIANRLGEISQFLMPGTLLTLVARLPEQQEGDYILSNDELVEAKKVIERHLDEKSIIGLNGKTL